MNSNIKIRMAADTDAEEILNIYSSYVLETAITFEYEVPSVSLFRKRIENICKKYPYIVALENNCIIGYAYASTFKDRAAYDWAVETTIYVQQDCRGKGVGKKLYFALEDILKRQNVLNLNACIAYTSMRDKHLDNSSAAFHQHFGYQKVGHFSKCGYKFETWYDMIWMEKILGKHDKNPVDFLPITEIQI